MNTTENTHSLEQKTPKNHQRILSILIIVLVVVAVIIGYIRLMEKQSSLQQEEKIPAQKTQVDTPTTKQPVTTTPSDEVTDIEADLKTTDISF